MAKTITIPTGLGSRIVVVLNGVKYIYTAGETVSVPDEIAEIFENNDGEKVIYGRRAVAPLEAPERLGNEEGAPVKTDDEGNLYVPAEGVLDAVRVSGHTLIISEE